MASSAAGTCTSNAIPPSPMEVDENTKPSQYDFAALYEAWHLQSTKPTNDDDDSGNVYAKAMAARAGKMGTLQCAIRNKSPTENPGFLNALVERMELGEDEMSAIPLPDFVYQSQAPNPQQHQHQQVHVSLDDFFNEYPECVRPDWEDIEDDDSSKESSEEEDEERQATKRKKPVESTMPAAEIPDQADVTMEKPPCILYSQNSHKRSENPKEHYNPQPQATAAPHNQHSMPPSASVGYNSHHPSNYQPQNYPADNNNNHGWDNDDSRNRGWSKDPNQFRTALEYQNDVGDNRASHPQDQHQHHSTNNDNGFQKQMQNPYMNPPQQQQQQQQQKEEDEVVVAQGPAIRDSLKRKFQVPKLGATGAQSSREPSNNKSNNSNPKKTAAKSQGTKNSTSKPSSNSNSNSEGSEEDDLPENLKKFGKDLVDKIKSEIMDTGDPVTFEDIAGLEDAKSTIHEIVCWPMKRPELFTGLRKVPNGLLLFGPPGTGKTLIGKAIAHASGATFFSISSSAMTSKWMGEGEKLVRTLFAVAAHHEPSCIFLDEVDSLLTQRKSDDSESSRRIKTQFLVELDGSGTSGQGRVLVIGATNRPQELDEAARRRFVKRLYIPLPTQEDRACLLNTLLAKNEHTLTAKEVEKLARDTQGFSGADLKALSADAAMGPIRQLGSKAMDIDVKDLPPIRFKHFRQSLRGMHASVSPDDVTQYIKFDETYGSKRAIEGQDDDCDSDDSESTPSP